MLRKLSRFFQYLKLKHLNDTNNYQEEERIIPDSIEVFKERLERVFYDCSDFSLREITLGDQTKVKLIVAFIDGLVDKNLVNNDVLRPLMIDSREADLSIHFNQSTALKILKNDLLTTCDLQEVKSFKQLVTAILAGDSIIYIDGERVGFKAGTRGWERRGIDEPQTEAVVRGPREGFSETLRTNTALLRRKIKNHKLKLEMLTLGEQTNTDICLCYIKDLVHRDILETVRRRLKRIKTDAILESGYIEEFIEDAPFSVFPTMANSEKPDIVAAKILEGRVAILCDGTPFVLTVPHFFIETLLSSEDYYNRPFFASLVRILRLLALILTTVLPGFYVAMVAFHQDVIPFKLLLTITASREGIPFSVFTETLLMGVTYELLREAGVRMPRPFGQAISIVGALVLGQAAVEAGITSTPVIMVTAITAITSFIIPPLKGTLPIIRLILILVANILGLLGMALVIIIIFIHMSGLRSFGIPYLAPFSPFTGADLKDTLLRYPLWAMWTRPRFLIKNNRNIEDEQYRMKKDIRTKED